MTDLHNSVFLQHYNHWALLRPDWKIPKMGVYNYCNQRSYTAHSNTMVIEYHLKGFRPVGDFPTGSALKHEQQVTFFSAGKLIIHKHPVWMLPCGKHCTWTKYGSPPAHACGELINACKGTELTYVWVHRMKLHMYMRLPCNTSRVLYIITKALVTFLDFKHTGVRSTCHEICIHNVIFIVVWSKQTIISKKMKNNWMRIILSNEQRIIVWSVIIRKVGYVNRHLQTFILHVSYILWGYMKFSTFTHTHLTCNCRSLAAAKYYISYSIQIPDSDKKGHINACSVGVQIYLWKMIHSI